IAVELALDEDAAAAIAEDEAVVAHRASSAENDSEPVAENLAASEVADRADARHSGRVLALKGEDRDAVGMQLGVVVIEDVACILAQDGAAVGDAAAADQANAIVIVTDDRAAVVDG